MTTLATTLATPLGAIQAVATLLAANAIDDATKAGTVILEHVATCQVLLKHGVHERPANRKYWLHADRDAAVLAALDACDGSGTLDAIEAKATCPPKLVTRKARKRAVLAGLLALVEAGKVKHRSGRGAGEPDRFQRARPLRAVGEAS